MAFAESELSVFNFLIVHFPNYFSDPIISTGHLMAILDLILDEYQ